MTDAGKRLSPQDQTDLLWMVRHGARHDVIAQFLGIPEKLAKAERQKAVALVGADATPSRSIGPRQDPSAERYLKAPADKHLASLAIAIIYRSGPPEMGEPRKQFLHLRASFEMWTRFLSAHPKADDWANFDRFVHVFFAFRERKITASTCKGCQLWYVAPLGQGAATNDPCPHCTLWTLNKRRAAAQSPQDVPLASFPAQYRD